jgi:hypothetical protein
VVVLDGLGVESPLHLILFSIFPSCRISPERRRYESSLTSFILVPLSAQHENEKSRLSVCMMQSSGYLCKTIMLFSNEYKLLINV